MLMKDMDVNMRTWNTMATGIQHYTSTQTEVKKKMLLFCISTCKAISCSDHHSWRN